MNPIDLAAGAAGGGGFSGSSSATSSTGDQYSSNAFNFNSGSQATNGLPMVAVMAAGLAIVALVLWKR